MSHQDDHHELFELALSGDKTAQERLAQIASRRLHEFVYRLTLQEDLTRDIVQEGLVEMIQLFNKPKPIDRFWHWLYGVAYNKVCSHYHYRHHRKALSLSEMEDQAMTTPQAQAQDQPLVAVVEQELRQIVLECIQALEPRYRAILTLRCYDRMAYSEIAGLMRCSEFGARTLFCRAKRSLAKRLSSYGLGKGVLLTALVVFGKITASSPASAAQVSVSAATLSAGTTASVAAVLFSKAALIPLAAGLLATGAITVPLMSQGQGTDQTLDKIMTASKPADSIEDRRAASAGWYFYPEGPDGPVMMRIQHPSVGQDSRWSVLQTDQGNYFSNGGQIELRNHRVWAEDLKMWTLPTDAGIAASPQSRRQGLLMVVSDDPNKQGPDRIQAVHHPNALQEDYFQPDRPTEVTWIDKRDLMHKRGWTWFELEGDLNGRPVTGNGLIPFVYAAYRQHRPWFQMTLGGQVKMVELGDAAYISDLKGTSRLAGGTFFKGLPRPWMGLHTLDLVRRDAIQCHLPFSSRIEEGRKALVEISHDRTALHYQIDLDTDVVDRIIFYQEDQKVGELRFRYLQDMEKVSGRLRAPNPPPSVDRTSLSSSQSQMWLVQLAEDSLGKE